MQPLEKANEIFAGKVKLIHQGVEKRLALKKLSKSEKTELYKTIRYSFLSQEVLLSLTSNESLPAEAKNFIIQGLAVKMD